MPDTICTVYVACSSRFHTVILSHLIFINTDYSFNASALYRTVPIPYLMASDPTSETVIIPQIYLYGVIHENLNHGFTVILIILGLPEPKRRGKKCYTFLRYGWRFLLELALKTAPIYKISLCTPLKLTTYPMNILQPCCLFPSRTLRKKERNPLQEGPLKGIGSSVGLHPYKRGVGINLGGTSS